MRIALFSDIHSNNHALIEAFRSVYSFGTDLIFVAGDIIGRGPNPVEVIQLLQEKIFLQ